MWSQGIETRVVQKIWNVKFNMNIEQHFNDKHHDKLKQINMVMKKWNNKEKNMYKLDQAFGIIMHAHDDLFSHFLVVTSIGITSAPTNSMECKFFHWITFNVFGFNSI
jgi:hypothetical protein